MDILNVVIAKINGEYTVYALDTSASITPSLIECIKNNVPWSHVEMWIRERETFPTLEKAIEWIPNEPEYTYFAKIENGKIDSLTVENIEKHKTILK